MHYWLLKSEPGCYSIDDLEKDKTSVWDGVRNFQARNFLRDSLKKNDLCLFYHSNANPSCAVGICRVVEEKLVDPTAFDPQDEHFDPKSHHENPTWFMVKVEFVRKFSTPVSLASMRKNPALACMLLLQKGNRLSVLPVEKQEFLEIEKMGEVEEN